MTFAEEKNLPHFSRHHRVSFVTISRDVKEPSSHRGGLICSLAMGAGLMKAPSAPLPTESEMKTFA